MNILVSGASGFIGRRVSARFHAERSDTNLCCLVKANEDPFCRAGIEFLQSQSIRVTPTELVAGIGIEKLPRPDLLLHFAANTHTWERDHACNDVGTENLIRSISPLGANSHVVFTSTTAVMDNRVDLDKPLAASPSVKQPFSPYGQSKLRAEEFLRAEAARQGFRLSIVRLCTVYGPQPRPNTLFDVLNREVARKSLASRLNWPGLTSFIHVDDVVSCLVQIGDRPPNPGATNTYLLATESGTLADVSRLLYRVKGLAYRAINLPKAAWNLLRNVHPLCRWGAGSLPVRAYNSLWRLDMVINPVFHCDTASMGHAFPSLIPRRMADCIGEI